MLDGALPEHATNPGRAVARWFRAAGIATDVRDLYDSESIGALSHIRQPDSLQMRPADGPGRRLTARRVCGMVLGLCLMLAACTPPLRGVPPPVSPVTLDAAVAGDPAQLVTLERNAAAARDLATLAALWAHDAQVLEHRGKGEADDYRWQGRDAVLDRYEVAVFPSPPAPLDAPLDLAPQVEGDAAVIVNGVDRWEFAYREGRWWIVSLQIGTP